jgi:hypothetical protein
VKYPAPGPERSAIASRWSSDALGELRTWISHIATRGPDSADRRMQTPRNKPPAAAEPLGSHCRGESATTPPLDFPSKDGYVGDSPTSEWARTTAIREAGHRCSGAAPHVECANPHPNVRRRRFGTLGPLRHARCALGAPRAMRSVLVRDAGGGGPHDEYARCFNRAVGTKHAPAQGLGHRWANSTMVRESNRPFSITHCHSDPVH